MSTPATAPPNSITPGTAPVRFGLIGTGRITRRLVGDLQSTAGVQVTAIGSRRLDRARWCADQYGVAAAVEGYDALLARDDVDAVYISLPPSLHTDWSIAAAAAGKHVLCEKPLAIRGDQVVQIDTACRRHGVRWLDATAWLHHGRTAQIGKWISDGRLGTVAHISAAVSFYEPFQSDEHRLDPNLGGGCLLDLGWYAAGLARWVTASLPTRVSAHARQRHGVPYRVMAMLEFADGVTATLSCGYDSATRKWFEVAGSAASVICDDYLRPWPDKPARCWIHDASGKVDQVDFHDQQEQRMIGRLIGDEDLAPWHTQALHTQRILDALQRSIDQAQPIDVASNDQEMTACE